MNLIYSIFITNFERKEIELLEGLEIFTISIIPLVSNEYFLRALHQQQSKIFYELPNVSLPSLILSFFGVSILFAQLSYSRCSFFIIFLGYNRNQNARYPATKIIPRKK